jgi:hypothetical protein
MSKPMRRLEALRMQPYTATQLALALGLAQFLAEYDADRIPDERKIQVRRLAVVGPLPRFDDRARKKKQSGYRFASHLFAPTNI